MNSEVINPVFIVGAPRSGTTLLRNLLNRHPEIGLCNETYYFYYVYHRQRTFGDPGDPEKRRFVIDRYLETSRVQRLQLPMDDLRDTLNREGTDYGRLFLSLMRFYARTQGKPIYGEKTPHHALESEALFKLFPDCRLIHLVRDPRDVTASLLRMPWGSSSVSANARLWLKCVSAAESCRNKKNYHRVTYESLACDPESVLKDICIFLGLPFDNDMLSQKSPDQADRWWFERALEPINRSRLEKWRDELTVEQISVIEWITGEFMDKLGYEREAGAPGKRLQLAAIAGELAAGLTARISGLPGIWYRWLQPAQLAAEEAWIDRKDAR